LFTTVSEPRTLLASVEVVLSRVSSPTAAQQELSEAPSGTGQRDAGARSCHRVSVPSPVTAAPRLEAGDRDPERRAGHVVQAGFDHQTLGSRAATTTTANSRARQTTKPDAPAMA
jgi:hypothetical protein